MPHRYKVREIAQQSGLSEATVDRVLNERPGVRENTRAEVAQAIADLDKQRAQLRLNGRRYLIDVVMQTPSGSPMRSGPRSRPNSRVRTGHVASTIPPMGVGVDGSDGRGARPNPRQSRSGPQGPGRTRGGRGHRPAGQSGVPVVTYATDVRERALRLRRHRQPRRRVTAAYLMRQWLGSAPSDVLITLSRAVFRGEGEREVGFRSAMRGSGRRDRRSQRQRRHRRDQRTTGSRGAGAATRSRRPFIRSAAATPRRSRRSSGSAGLPGVHRTRPRRRQPAVAA